MINRKDHAYNKYITISDRIKFKPEKICARLAQRCARLSLHVLKLASLRRNDAQRFRRKKALLHSTLLHGPPRKVRRATTRNVPRNVSSQRARNVFAADIPSVARFRRNVSRKVPAQRSAQRPSRNVFYRRARNYFSVRYSIYIYIYIMLYS